VVLEMCRQMERDEITARRENLTVSGGQRSSRRAVMLW
jgi:hypothetical protein